MEFANTSGSSPGEENRSNDATKIAMDRSLNSLLGSKISIAAGKNIPRRDVHVVRSGAIRIGSNDAKKVWIFALSEMYPLPGTTYVNWDQTPERRAWSHQSEPSSAQNRPSINARGARKR
jgi:hypothetical protein